MPTFSVEVKMVYRVEAASAVDAERAVQARVCAPEDDPPGQLTNYRVRAKEVQ